MKALRAIVALLLLMASAVALADAEAVGKVISISVEDDEIRLDNGLVLRINDVPLVGIAVGTVVAVEYDENDGEYFLASIKKAPAN
jgi:hypothetical protein